MATRLKRALNIRSISLSLLIIALTAGLGLAANSKFFNLKDIEVQTTDKNTTEFINKFMITSLNEQLDLWRGKNIWWVSTDQIYAAVLNIPWIEQAEIRRVWPSGLKVTIRPKSVVALIANPKGELVPVGVWGELLPVMEGAKNPDVPILQGASFYKDQLLRRQAVEMILSLPTESSLSTQTLQSVSYSESKGFVLTVANVRGPVILGTGELAQKVFRANRVLEYLSSQSLESRVIDATYDKKVLVRLRKGP